MYAGHAALALFTKSKRPALPLALLVPVAFGPDWVQWLAQAVGRHNREISHSIVSVVALASVVAFGYRVMASNAGRDDIAVWLLYASHWPADFITGIKPTWPGGPEVGMMLYAHPVADVVLESALIWICWLAYRRSLPEVARGRSIAPLIPLGLIVMQIGSAILGGFTS